LLDDELVEEEEVPVPLAPVGKAAEDGSSVGNIKPLTRPDEEDDYDDVKDDFKNANL